MNAGTESPPPRVQTRLAGTLYLAIIVLGLFSELAVRSSLIVSGDPAATAANIMASEGLFRAGLLADSIMFLCDVGLAVLLFVLLKPVDRTLALAAMFFRITQAAVIALNLLNYHAAVMLLDGTGYTTWLDAGDSQALAYLFLDLHSHGYDLGLIAFGVHCLILGYLIAKSGYMPKALGYLVAAAGVTYLIGSYTRFLLPEFVRAVSPIYAVAVISELSLCLWLLLKGVDPRAWSEAAGDAARRGSNRD